MNKECRICFEEECEDNKLISPCDCKGTSKYVHLKCLQKWRNESMNNEAKDKCIECRKEYIIRKKYKKESLIYKIKFSSFFSTSYLFLIPFSFILSNSDENCDVLYLLDFGNESPGYKLCKNATDFQYYRCSFTSLKIIYTDSYFLRVVFYLFYLSHIQYILFIFFFISKIKRKINRLELYYKNSLRLKTILIMTFFKFPSIYYLFVHILNIPFLFLFFSFLFGMTEFLNYILIFYLHNEIIKFVNEELNPEYILSFDINPIFEHHVLEIKYDI